MIHFFIALLFSSVSYAGDVLFIDLNNSKKEVDACEAGMKATNSEDNIYVLGAGHKIDADSIAASIREFEDGGASFDSIVISGHDGSGHFFGDNGDFLSSELKVIAHEDPKLRDSLTNMALWGCYTTTDQSCQNYWMKNISPNIKSTVGFTLQSPSNKREGGFVLLQDYCKKRQAIAAADTSAEMAKQFNGLKNLGKWNISICYQDGVCSKDYNRPKDSAATCYHSYDELLNRCREFDPTEKQLEMYQKFFQARGEGFEDPPFDDENDFTSAGGDKTKFRPDRRLRLFYGQLHLWRHCVDLLKAETGYLMPLPAQVIRLVKFDMFKRNFENIHKKELNQYNAKLIALGLNQYILEPTRDSRREIVSKTEGAKKELSRMASGVRTSENPVDSLASLFNLGPKPASVASPVVNGVDTRKLLVMASGFDLSLRQLDYHCSDFSLVHEDATLRSPCITSYGGIPSWPR